MKGINLFLLSLAIIAFIATFYYLTSVVVTVFVAFLLASLMEPPAKWLYRFGVPKVVTVLGVYALLMGIVVGVGALVVPPLVMEVNLLAERYDGLLQAVGADDPVLVAISDGSFFTQEWGDIVNQIKDWQFASIFRNGATSALSAVGTVFGGMVAFLGMLVLALYVVIEPPKVSSTLLKAYFPPHWKEVMEDIVPKVRKQASAWLRGQLLIMLIVGVLVYILLSALGVPFALILAIIAGLLEIIPFLGPNLAAIPAIIVGASVSWPVALLTLIGYIAIQQFENHILTPTVYKKVAGVNPVVTIIAFLVGFELGHLIGGNVLTSVLGGALALPVTVTVGEFVQELAKWRLKKHGKQETYET